MFHKFLFNREWYFTTFLKDKFSLGLSLAVVTGFGQIIENRMNLKEYKYGWYVSCMWLCDLCWRKVKKCKFKNMNFDLNIYRLLSLSEKERRYVLLCCCLVFIKCWAKWVIAQVFYYESSYMVSGIK